MVFFLKFLCFLCDPTDVDILISGSSAFSKSSLYIWKFLVHVLLKPGLENFEHYFATVWDECSRVVVWTFFGIAFLWGWNENWPFSSPVATAEFSRFPGILSAALSHHHLLGFEIAELEFRGTKYHLVIINTALSCTVQATVPSPSWFEQSTYPQSQNPPHLAKSFLLESDRRLGSVRT